MKRIVLLFAIMLAFMPSDARPKKKKKAVKKAIPVQVVTKSTSIETNTMRMCESPNSQPTWFLATPVGFKFPANFQAPASYRLLTVIDTSFMNFLNGVPYEQSKCTMMLPVYINQTVQCHEFQITRVETMDSALQAKYPQLMSFKARTASNGLNAARIDCDETAVKISITFDGKQYFVTPVSFNKKTYYACYAKDDVNFVKDRFER